MSRNDSARDLEGSTSSRTGTTILLIGFVIILAGGFAARFAPDVFASLGGWVTVTVVAVLMVVLGSYSFIRGMRSHPDASDDDAR